MDIDDVDLSFVQNMIDKVDDHTEIKFASLCIAHPLSISRPLTFRQLIQIEGLSVMVEISCEKGKFNRFWFLCDVTSFTLFHQAVRTRYRVAEE